jgi:hypothetical protein
LEQPPGVLGRVGGFGQTLRDTFIPAPVDRATLSPGELETLARQDIARANLGQVLGGIAGSEPLQQAHRVNLGVGLGDLQQARQLQESGAGVAGETALANLAIGGGSQEFAQGFQNLMQQGALSQEQIQRGQRTLQGLQAAEAQTEVNRARISGLLLDEQRKQQQLGLGEVTLSKERREEFEQIGAEVINREFPGLVGTGVEASQAGVQ